MKSTPAYILRDCALWFNEDLKVGQATAMTIPPLKAKTEQFRNAGMMTDRKARYGYVREPAKFKQMGLDPQVVGAINLRPGSTDTLMITGALVDEDGTVTNATAYMRGFNEGIDFEEWKSGEKIEAIDVTFEWDYLKLDIGGVNKITADDFDVIINGASQYGDIRAALLLD
jgi:P2 family phage contractile tail tube protein